MLKVTMKLAATINLKLSQSECFPESKISQGFFCQNNYPNSRITLKIFRIETGFQEIRRDTTTELMEKIFKKIKSSHHSWAVKKISVSRTS